jgi:hypothetical protein
VREHAGILIDLPPFRRRAKIAAERDTTCRSGAGTLLSALAWSRIHGLAAASMTWRPPETILL